MQLDGLSFCFRSLFDIHSIARRISTSGIADTLGCQLCKRTFPNSFLLKLYELCFLHCGVHTLLSGERDASCGLVTYSTIWSALQVRRKRQCVCHLAKMFVSCEEVACYSQFDFELCLK